MRPRNRDNSKVIPAATGVVVSWPHRWMPPKSKDVLTMPSKLAPSMAVDIARPYNRSNQGASVLPAVLVDRQTISKPST